MAIMIIENVSEEMIKTFGKVVDFNSNKISIKPLRQILRKNKKDPTIRLQKLVDDPENTSYGPFYTVDEAIAFLNRDLG